MSQQAIVRTAKGLFSHFNRLETPSGAMLVADNCVIDRPGVIEKRRGFDRYGDDLDNAGATLLKFDRRLVVLDGTTLKYDSDGAGTWASYTGTFSPPTDCRLEGVEAQLSLYFTTSNGPYKLDSITGTPIPAGVPPGLDVQATTYYSATGFLAADEMVGYRIVFGRVDANGQEVIGEPTPRVTVYNPVGGTTSNVRLEFTVPDGLSVATQSFYEVYRTATLPSVSTLPAGFKDPGDRERLVVRKTFTYLDGNVDSDIFYGKIVYGDTLEEESLGADLYTNPLLETDTKGNSPPPYAEHVAFWKGHLWLANTREYHRKEIWLYDVDGITDNTDTITITSGSTSIVYTFSTAESLALRRFKRWTTEATLSENIRKTMESFCKILNREPTNTLFWARYISGLNDNPGRVEIRTRDFSSTAFTVTATSGCSTKFSPNIPTAGTTYASINDAKANWLYHSKYEKPEAVPISNYDAIGSETYKILALVPLKDALVILKEDGYYSVTGSSDGSNGASFTISLLDPTLKLLSSASAVTLDNAVYAMTTQGVVRSTESGSKIMSWPIERDLQQIAQIQDFGTVTHAIAYESDRKYLLATQTTGNATPQVVWVYNYVTEAWTRWPIPISSGIVLEQSTGGDKLFLAHETDPYILAERKSFSTADEDFTDWGITGSTVSFVNDITVDGETVSLVTIVSTTEPHQGWLLSTSTGSGIVSEVVVSAANVYDVTLDRKATITGGQDSTLYQPISMRVEWMPEYGGNAASMKQFSEGQIYFESQGGTHVMGFCADTQGIPGYTDPIVYDKTYGWGRSPWGSTPWGDGSISPASPTRSWVPRDHQRCRGMRLIYTNDQAQERVAILQVAYGIRDYGNRTQANPR